MRPLWFTLSSGSDALTSSQRALTLRWHGGKLGGRMSGRNCRGETFVGGKLSGECLRKCPGIPGDVQGFVWGKCGEKMFGEIITGKVQKGKFPRECPGKYLGAGKRPGVMSKSNAGLQCSLYMPLSSTHRQLLTRYTISSASQAKNLDKFLAPNLLSHQAAYLVPTNAR